jgi:SAM-dependent methyltransferase
MERNSLTRRSRRYVSASEIMDATFEAKYHRLEQEQWWFRSRRNAICNLLEPLDLSRDAAILEIGCSSGPLLLALRAAGYRKVKGIDTSQKAVDRARQRDLIDVEVMDGAKLGFADGSFDVVIASDVLEHIENDQRAVEEWKRVLSPGGTLLIFVPALKFLWSRHDEVNQHFRRYSAAKLRAVIQNAGLLVERTSYWNFLLTFPGLALALFRRALSAAISNQNTGDLVRLPKIINEMLYRLVWTENQALRLMDFPLGTSAFVIARRPAK